MDEKRLKEKLAKIDMSLLPGRALESIASVLTHGAKKHGRESWKDYPIEAYIAAIGRHYAKVLEGKIVDEEFGETHFAHMAASCMFLDWLYHNKE